MIQVSVDFNKIIGKIKIMHAVGQPPFAPGRLNIDFSYMHYLTDAGIPYSRLHDVGGPFGSNRYVDIPNLFRDFDADENDPSSYDFAFTDELIKAMTGYNISPVFRLGVTIENQAHVKAYRIHPPKDFAKWARICEHVIRHYNEGWANGFHFGIEYWEIWNEPENGPPRPGENQMWTGTAEQFYEMYDVTAKHLKKCFGDSIKVGGYGASGLYGIYYHPNKYGVDVPEREKDGRYEQDIYRVEFFNGFLEYAASHGSPLDFFSWHSYAKVEKTLVIDGYIRKRLTEYGFEKVEMHLNEWNNVRNALLNGKSYASAATAAMMCGMQNSHTDILCYYDSRLTAGTYGGFFTPITCDPTCTYYVFKAFNYLYSLSGQAECTVENEEEGFYTLAATDKNKHAVMIVNFSEESREISFGGSDGLAVYVLDEDHNIEKTSDSVSSFTIKPNQVVLLSDQDIC